MWAKGTFETHFQSIYYMVHTSGYKLPDYFLHRYYFLATSLLQSTVKYIATAIFLRLFADAVVVILFYTCQPRLAWSWLTVVLPPALFILESWAPASTSSAYICFVWWTASTWFVYQCTRLTSSAHTREGVVEAGFRICTSEHLSPTVLSFSPICRALYGCCAFSCRYNKARGGCWASR